MSPLDPRLIRRSRAARGFLVAGGALALVQTAAVAAFAWALAGLVAGFVDGIASGAATPLLVTLAAAACVRAIAAWMWDTVGSAGAMRVKHELRMELLSSVARNPGGIAEFPPSQIAGLLGHGLDALDDYFGRYVPQLVLSAVATPILIAAAWLADPLSGLILVLVLPLVPVFMALIGMATEAVQRRQWQGLASLSRGFLEVVGGLSTLALFGREHRQSERIRTVTADYRRRTMRVLRVTFLSGFTLELAASLSVALVAVSIGLRLVAGDMALTAGLFVLVLAPEVFLPLRNVGAAFHASAAGAAASAEAFDLLDAAPGSSAGTAASDGSHRAPDATGLQVRDLRVLRGGRAVIDGFELDARPGEVVAVTGESGVGKSTLLAALLGFVAIERGSMRLDGRPLGATPAGIAWAGQSSRLLRGTIASNVRLGDEYAPYELLETALALAGVDLDPSTPVGHGGGGLSGGQAQRVATARAVHRMLARDLRLLLLDEPSSALDPEREAELAARLHDIADDGRIVILVTHRQALIAAADRIVPIEAVSHV